MSGRHRRRRRDDDDDDDDNGLPFIWVLIAATLSGAAIAALGLGINSTIVLQTTVQQVANQNAVSAMQINTTALSTVYLNPASGSDANDGKTPATALRSIGAALRAFNGISAEQCVIYLLSDLNLGANPVLNFFPATDRCGLVFVRGVELNVVTDTVAALGQRGVSSYRWLSITGTAGGYAPNLYQRRFIRNLVYNNIFVVDGNTASVVDVVAAYEGNFQITPIDPLPPNTTDSFYFYVGQTFQLFTVTTKITWTGLLLMNIPSKVVTFESLNFAPTTLGSRVRMPDGPQHRGIFRACVMDIWSANFQFPAFFGSMVMQGCYLEGMVPGAYVTGTEEDRCLIMESTWAHEASVFYSGSCRTIGFYSTDSPGFGFHTSGATGFVASNVRIIEPVGTAVFLGQSSLYAITRFEAIRTIGPIFQLVAIDNESNGLFSNAAFTCPLCTYVIWGAKSTSILLSAMISITGRTAVLLSAQARIEVLPTSFILSVAVNGFEMAPMSSMVLRFTLTTTSINLAIAGGSSIIACIGCEVQLDGPSTSYLWATNTGVPLIAVSAGGKVYDFTTGPALVNLGPTPTHVVKCGSLAISAGTVNQFDSAGDFSTCIVL